jgi:hypothetical protein
MKYLQIILWWQNPAGRLTIATIANWLFDTVIFMGFSGCFYHLPTGLLDVAGPSKSNKLLGGSSHGSWRGGQVPVAVVNRGPSIRRLSHSKTWLN